MTEEAKENTKEKKEDLLIKPLDFDLAFIAGIYAGLVIVFADRIVLPNRGLGLLEAGAICIVILILFSLGHFLVFLVNFIHSRAR